MMDFDSEFEFQWNGWGSPFTWCCQILVLIVFGLASCFEIIFCGRWRDLLPIPPVDVEAVERQRREDGREFRKEYAPVPLPSRRIRQLSIAGSISTSEASAGGEQTWINAQTESSFCSILPWEVRQMIYQDAIIGPRGIFHILEKEKRLGYWRCKRLEKGRACDWSIPCHVGWMPYRWSWSWALHSGERSWCEHSLCTDGDLLQMPLTCRKIYIETITLLYARPIFHFPDPGTIPYFAATILPQRLSLIQSIELDWEGYFSISNRYGNVRYPESPEGEWDAWASAWDVISKMEGLKEIQVHLKKTQYTYRRNRPNDMWQPMMNVKGVRVFEITVERDEDRLRAQVGDALGDAPFRILPSQDVILDV